MEDTGTEGSLHAAPSDGSLTYEHPPPEPERLSLDKRSASGALFGDRVCASRRRPSSRLDAAAAA